MKKYLSEARGRLASRGPRATALALAITLILSLASCRETPSAVEMMTEFSDALGISPTVYSPAVKEGEAGYISEGFFEALYGESPGSVSDYALILLSNLEGVGECGVFICYSDYDAVLVCDMLGRRLELIRSLGGSIDASPAEDAFILRRGRIVVFSAMSDNALSYKLWNRII